MVLYDFYYYYAMARLLVNGQNIYDRDLLAQEMQRIGWQQDYVFGTGYPPWMMYVLIPFAFLPFTYALLGWAVASFSAVSIAIRSLRFNQAATFPSSISIPLPIYIFFALTFFPTTESLIYGQLGWLQLLGLVLFLRTPVEKDTFQQGAILALCFAKLHLLIPLFALLIWQSLRGKKYHFLSGLALVGILQLLIALFFKPTILYDYSTHILTFSKAAQTLLSATLPQLIFVRTGILIPPPVWVISGLCFAYLLSLRFKLTNEALIFVYLPLSLLFAPYCWGHDLIVLTIPYLVLLSRIWSKNRTRAYILSISFLALSFSLSDRSHLEQWKSLIPLMFLILGVILLLNQGTKPVSNSKKFILDKMN